MLFFDLFPTRQLCSNVDRLSVRFCYKAFLRKFADMGIVYEILMFSVAKI